MSMSVLMWVCVGEKEKVVVDYQKARLKNSSPHPKAQTQAALWLKARKPDGLKHENCFPNEP